MSISILADTHIAKATATQLRNNGVDIIRLEEIDDLANDASDRDILRYATQQGRAVLSLDRDFETLHYELMEKNVKHTGIFLGDSHLQGNVGVLVSFLVEYNELVEDITLDVHNQLIQIKNK